MKRSYLWLLCLALAGACSGCTETYPTYSTEYNLDFEYALSDSVPAQWTLRNTSLTGYEYALDRQTVHHGAASLRARWSERTTLPGSWGGFQTFLPAGQAAGREVEISGWIKTRDSVNLRAGFGIFPFVPDRTPMDFLSRIDTTGGVRGTSDWTRCTTRLKIDSAATSVMIAGFASGVGSAWFDDLEIRIDGKRIAEREIPLVDKLSPADRQALLRYVHPLATWDPTAPDTDDLDALGQAAAGCRIVGLGENTHGTGEVFAMKDRIVRYLTDRHGFGIFALEANLPEAERVNDYTIRGEGDPKQLIRGMYVWPWMTDEMLTMAEWMKTVNTPEPRITFTGVDLQMPTTLMAALQRLLPASGSAARRAAALAEQLQHIYTRSYQLDVELARKLEPELDALAADSDLASLSGEKRTEIGGYIDMLRAFLSQYRDSSWRDRGMAGTMAWIMALHPESRAVLWAHNQHINQREGTTRLIRPTGFYLKEQFGDGYLSVGFATGQGTYTAWKNGLRAFELPAPAPGTLEHVLGQLDEPIFLLDLKRMRQEQAPQLQWLDALSFREIGATPEVFYHTGISEAFDCLIFIRNTSASHLLQF